MSYRFSFLSDADDEELAGHALSLFFEGFETSANAISLLLMDLAENVDIQQRLHDEIVDVMERRDNKFTYDAMQEMTYLDKVVLGKLLFCSFIHICHTPSC